MLRPMRYDKSSIRWRLCQNYGPQGRKQRLPHYIYRLEDLPPTNHGKINKSTVISCDPGDHAYVVELANSGLSDYTSGKLNRLQSFSFVTVLNLASNNLGDVTCRLLRVVCKISHLRIESVNLSSNPGISDLGAGELAEWIAMDQGLSSLEIADTSITDDGIAHIAEAIYLSHTFYYLDVSHNAAISLIDNVFSALISARIGQKMSTQMKQTSEVLNVHLLCNSCNLNDASLVRLSQATPADLNLSNREKSIPRWNYLRSISLACNPGITRYGIDRLAYALSNSMTFSLLRVLDISQLSVTQESLITLFQALTGQSNLGLPGNRHSVLPLEHVSMKNCGMTDKLLPELVSFCVTVIRSPLAKDNYDIHSYTAPDDLPSLNICGNKLSPLALLLLWTCTLLYVPCVRADTDDRNTPKLYSKSHESSTKTIPSIRKYQVVAVQRLELIACELDDIKDYSKICNFAPHSKRVLSAQQYVLNIISNKIFPNGYIWDKSKNSSARFLSLFASICAVDQFAWIRHVAHACTKENVAGRTKQRDNTHAIDTTMSGRLLTQLSKAFDHVQVSDPSSTPHTLTKIQEATSQVLKGLGDWFYSTLGDVLIEPLEIDTPTTRYINILPIPAPTDTKKYDGKIGRCKELEPLKKRATRKIRRGSGISFHRKRLELSSDIVSQHINSFVINCRSILDIANVSQQAEYGILDMTHSSVAVKQAKQFMAAMHQSLTNQFLYLTDEDSHGSKPQIKLSVNERFHQFQILSFLKCAANTLSGLQSHHAVPSQTTASNVPRTIKNADIRTYSQTNQSISIKALQKCAILSQTINPMKRAGDTFQPVHDETSKIVNENKLKTYTNNDDVDESKKDNEAILSTSIRDTESKLDSAKQDDGLVLSMINLETEDESISVRQVNEAILSTIDLDTEDKLNSADKDNKAILSTTSPETEDKLDSADKDDETVLSTTNVDTKAKSDLTKQADEALLSTTNPKTKLMLHSQSPKHEKVVDDRMAQSTVDDNLTANDLMSLSVEQLTHNENVNMNNKGAPVSQKGLSSTTHAQTLTFQEIINSMALQKSLSSSISIYPFCDNGTHLNEQNSQEHTPISTQEDVCHTTASSSGHQMTESLNYSHPNSRTYCDSYATESVQNRRSEPWMVSESEAVTLPMNSSNAVSYQSPPDQAAYGFSDPYSALSNQHSKDESSMHIGATALLEEWSSSQNSIHTLLASEKLNGQEEAHVNSEKMNGFIAPVDISFKNETEHCQYPDTVRKDRNKLFPNTSVPHETVEERSNLQPQATTTAFCSIASSTSSTILSTNGTMLGRSPWNDVSSQWRQNYAIADEKTGGKNRDSSVEQVNSTVHDISIRSSDPPLTREVHKIQPFTNWRALNYGDPGHCTTLEDRKYKSTQGIEEVHSLEYIPNTNDSQTNSGTHDISNVDDAVDSLYKPTRTMTSGNYFMKPTNTVQLSRTGQYSSPSSNHVSQAELLSVEQLKSYPFTLLQPQQISGNTSTDSLPMVTTSTHSETTRSPSASPTEQQSVHDNILSMTTNSELQSSDYQIGRIQQSQHRSPLWTTARAVAGELDMLRGSLGALEARYARWASEYGDSYLSDSRSANELEKNMETADTNLIADARVHDAVRTANETASPISSILSISPVSVQADKDGDHNSGNTGTSADNDFMRKGIVAVDGYEKLSQPKLSSEISNSERNALAYESDSDTSSEADNVIWHGQLAEMLSPTFGKPASSTYSINIANSVTPKKTPSKLYGRVKKSVRSAKSQEYDNHQKGSQGIVPNKTHTKNKGSKGTKHFSRSGPSMQSGQVIPSSPPNIVPSTAQRLSSTERTQLNAWLTFGSAPLPGGVLEVHVGMRGNWRPAFFTITRRDVYIEVEHHRSSSGRRELMTVPTSQFQLVTRFTNENKRFMIANAGKVIEDVEFRLLDISAQPVVSHEENMLHPISNHRIRMIPVLRSPITLQFLRILVDAYSGCSFNSGSSDVTPSKRQFVT